LLHPWLLHRLLLAAAADLARRRLARGAPLGATEAVALGYSVVLAEDCTAGATPETHQMQITEHLPLLATITTAGSVIASLPTPPQPH